MAPQPSSAQPANAPAQPASATPARKRASGPLAELNDLLASPYYSLNIALTLSYGAIRTAFADRPLQQVALFLGDMSDYAAWERYVAFLCACYGAFRCFKARSRAAAAAAVLDYTQLFVAIMALACSPMLLAHLVLAYLLIYLLFPPPARPLHEALEPLGPEELADHVKQPGSDTAWVVYCHAPFHRPSRCLAPVVADLATRYATDRLRFAYVDVGEFARYGTKSLGLDISPISQQLPTIILFDKGEEVTRLPVRHAGGALTGANWCGKDVVRAMELDMRYARSMQKGAGGGGGGGAGAGGAAEIKKAQ